MTARIIANVVLNLFCLFQVVLPLLSVRSAQNVFAKGLNDRGLGLQVGVHRDA